MSALTDQTNMLLIPVEDEETIPDEILSAAANAGHTGAMIALVPSDYDLQRLAGDEPADQLHLTLAFLGEAAGINDDTRRRIMEAATGYFNAPVETEATNVIVLNPHTDERETAIAMGVRGMDLVGPRENIMSAVRGVFSFEETFKPWLPHVTMAWTDDIQRVSEFAAQLGPITFDKIRFAFGDEVTDIPLGNDLLIAAFRESEHPRDRRGRFTRKGSGPLSTISTKTAALRSGIDSGIKERRALSGGGMAIVDRVTFKDGSEAVRKNTKKLDTGRSAKDQQDAEELSALVAGAVGAQVPTIVRTGDNEMYMELIEDEPAVAWMRDAEIAEVSRTPAGVRLGLLDMLIANPDRHKGNFMVSDDMKTLTGIDHGAAWDADTEVFEQGPFATNNFGKTNPLTDEDVAAVRERLEKLQTEFDRLGHPDWFQQMMDTLDWIGKRADGKVRIVK